MDPQRTTNQKRTPPWWCHLPGSAAWQSQVSQYPHGNLFGMGWPRTPSKGLLNIVNWPRKKIISELINFILVIISSQLNCPQNTLPPCSPPVKSPCLSLLHYAHVFLVGCCVWNINWRPFKATTNFLFFIFCHSVCPPKRWYSIRPTCSAQVVLPPQYPSYRKRQLLVGFCVVQPKDSHLRPRSHPSF